VAEVRTFAVSDVHGHVGKLRDALYKAGLTGVEGEWAGTDARLWFLGDYFDRGPDGIAVVDLVRRLQEQSAGAVRALIGNHEVLALGMHLFGTTEVPHDGLLSRTFERSWLLNGGRDADQERLTDDHVAWLRGLPVLALDGDHLLMHSDTIEYLEWGRTVDDVNATAARLLASDDIGTWWEVWRLLTSRYAFRGRHGAAVAGRLLDQLGGRRIVHGHSPIADLAGVEPAALTAPVLYADGRVLGIDGGVFDEGPCLVAELTP
jgi:Calcineurin-like phosphoesterase